jgi:hypothetical protein
MKNLRFTSAALSRPTPRGLAAETTLQHFVIVTYRVDPAVLRRLVHPRFEPDCIAAEGHGPSALISVVTFLDRDFRFVACPWPRVSFGQTNYRAYVTDTETGEHVAWFFGTCLDSISVTIPRYVWNLPWHRARMDFDCRFDESTARYTAFSVVTRSRWAPATLEVSDTGRPPRRLDGFPDLEAGLVLLTHPLRGYFHRRDGSLGRYAIWHERMAPTDGAITAARYPLLKELGLLAKEDEIGSVHSVLLQRRIDFTIYLPPRRVRGI